MSTLVPTGHGRLAIEPTKVRPPPPSVPVEGYPDQGPRDRLAWHRASWLVPAGLAMATAVAALWLPDRSKAKKREPGDSQAGATVPASGPQPRPGYLSIEATPRAAARAVGLRLGETPIAGVELPPGTYTVTLSNSELGLERSIVVRVAPDRQTMRVAGLD